MNSMRNDAITDGVDHRFREYLCRGEFRIPFCESCLRGHFYPRLYCPFCGSGSLAWRAPSGRGNVYSTTVVRRRGDAHNVALVDLAEGPRLMTRVEDLDPAQVAIGMAVEAQVRVAADGPLLVFVPRADR